MVLSIYFCTKYRLMKKYIFKHPELTRHFNEKNSIFHGNTWSPWRQNYIGSGFKHDDKLIDKKWELSTRIVNEVLIRFIIIYIKETELDAYVNCQILYFNPTDFVIEYLRVDIGSPIYKKITIIDGRKDSKEWIGEYKDDVINKRVYPKYRKGDEVEY